MPQRERRFQIDEVGEHFGDRTRLLECAVGVRLRGKQRGERCVAARRSEDLLVCSAERTHDRGVELSPRAAGERLAGERLAARQREEHRHPLRDLEHPGERRERRRPAVLR